MKLTRILIPIAAAALAVTAPEAARAQPYPPPAPVVTVSDTTVVVGDTVEVTGTGFAAGEPVAIDVEYQTIGMGRPRGARSFMPNIQRLDAVTVRADGAGAFRYTLALTRAGRAIITCTGVHSGRSGSASVLVLTSGAELPSTGTNGGSYLRIGMVGLALTLVGGVLFAITVRRRRARSSSS